MLKKRIFLGALTASVSATAIFWGSAQISHSEGAFSFRSREPAAKHRVPAGKVFRFRLPFEPATLDWNLGDVPIPVVQNTMRGLYRVDEKGAIAPDLVDQAQTLEDGRLWKIKLKPGVKWSDGVPLHADHVVESFRRLLDPKTGSSYAYFLYDIQGAKAFNTKKASDQNLGVKATSASSLEIRLEQAVPFLPAILTHWVTFPVRPDLIEKWPDHWTNPKHMAALGPWQISEWRPHIRIVMTRNAHTGGANQAVSPWLDRIEGWVVADDNTALNLYETGHLEFMTDPGQLTTQHAHMVHYPSPIHYFIGIGPGHPLTSSRTGVLALSAALDRREIPQVLNAPHRPVVDFCPPELWQALGGKRAPSTETLGLISLEGSVSQAKKFLAEAGFGNKPVPPITLKFFNRPAMKELAEWLQAQWKKNLGITVLLEGQEPKTYWSTLGAQPAALFLNSKGAAYPDPDSYFRLFSGSNPQNLGRWKDTDYDQWVHRAAALPTLEERERLYVQGTKRLLVERPALIPLYLRSTAYLIKPFVKDISINPLTSVDFSKVRYQ